MTSWDDFETDATASAYPGPKCATRIMLDSLGPDAKAAVLHAFANYRLTSTSIHKALESRIPATELASPQSINRHRRGACNCDKDVKQDE